MDTVCQGKQWDVLVSNSQGEIFGTMPFLFGKKFGLKYSLQPQLTPWGGPWVKPGLDEKSRHYTLAALAAAMQRRHFALYRLCLPPGTADYLPFQEAGFNHTTRHTYRFDPIPEPSTLRRLAAKERRKGIAAVENAYSVDRTVPVEEFADFHTAYWERRSGKDLLSRDFIIHVCSTALNRRQALLYGLRDKAGTLMAARFVVFDSHCAYSLLSALHADALRNSMTLLVWTMITDLHDRTKAFDFEGGMDPGIGHFYHSFGTTKTEIPCIYRSSIPFGKKLLHL